MTRESKARVWLQPEEKLESLVVGDVVSLELPLFPWSDHTHAVYEGIVNGRRSFLDIDTYLKNKHERDIERVLTRSAEDKYIIMGGGSIILNIYDSKWAYEVNSSIKNKKELIKAGIKLLRPIYTFDKVVTVDRHNRPIKVEKNKCIL